ncbi:MAG: type II secretion system protein N [Pseudomonadota bacterium]
MRLFGLILLFVLVFVGVAIATMPLSFALKRANLNASGIVWTQASGTIGKGVISGLQVGAQPIGNVDLKLRWRSLLTAKLAYVVDWSGAVGRGHGELVLGRNVIDLFDLSTEVPVSQLVGLSDELRRNGGSARISGAQIRFVNAICDAASGDVSTDTVSRLAQSYGQSASPLRGTFRCDGPMLTLPLTGTSATGETLAATLRVGTAEVSSMAARVETENPEFAAILALQGFQPEAGGYVYRRETWIGGQR